MTEVDIDDIEDVLQAQFNQLWTKNMVAECFKRGLTKKQTIQYMYDLAEFTTNIIQELHEREGQEKEVIQK